MSVHNVTIFVGSGGTKNHVHTLCAYLKKRDIAYTFTHSDGTQVKKSISDGKTQLVIVLGGDGSFLHACQLFANHAIALIGINLGRLGFLTDISFNDLEKQLDPVFAGEGITETRHFLSGSNANGSFHALNDIVIQTARSGRLIDLEVAINNKAAFNQRCDGMIIASSTGSTAYALSAGGPLLHPSVNAFMLVPLAAHDISARPCIIPTKDIMTIHLLHRHAAHVNFDGNEEMILNPGQSITIKVSTRSVTLVHPPGYDYFAACRSKLGWHGR